MRKKNISSKTGRRRPIVSAALLALGLVATGGVYAAFSATTASAEVDLKSQEVITQGQKLFAANCATCHGQQAQGTKNGPSLIGVGSAAVDFQVGTGRMPMQAQGPQAPSKPVQFTDAQTKALAAYVASLKNNSTTETSPRVANSFGSTVQCATT
jgi:ubiquinol-cytochrome c reductase cytochrome c subunit